MFRYVLTLVPFLLFCAYAKPPQPHILSRHLRVDIVWGGPQFQRVEVQRADTAEGPFETIASGPQRIPLVVDFVGEADRTCYYRIRRTFGKTTGQWSQVVAGTSRQSTDEELLTEVQEASFRYFYDFGHPVSGLAREGSHREGHLCAIGASGMGLVNLVVGIERGFISRHAGSERAAKILRFLSTRAHRWRGAYSHWLNGSTGAFIRFGNQNDGADLVETAFLAQGFLLLREYFDAQNALEEEIRQTANQLWREIQWPAFAVARGNRHLLEWLRFSEQPATRRLPIAGFNEAQIVYLLALGSPTHPVAPRYYREGWERRHYSRPQTQFGIHTEFGHGISFPLFFTHYSYLGFDPRVLSYRGRSYFEHFQHACRIQVQYARSRANDFKGYGPLWGFTSSMDPGGYSNHQPGTPADNGTIAPTAALSSMPYVPEEALACLRVLYEQHGAKIWDEFGFRDAFNPQQEWVARGVLGIDIGPISPMIENHRTGLPWRIFMQAPEIHQALKQLGQ